MIRGTKGKMFMVLAVLVLSLAFAGLASAATSKMIKQDGVEFVALRQAAEMSGYMVEWNGKEQSVTLTYAGTMMDDGMMTDDSTMMDDSAMLDDDMMMDDDMKQAGQIIKVWIGSKKVTVDGKSFDLDAAAMIYHNSTYVSAAFVTKVYKTGFINGWTYRRAEHPIYGMIELIDFIGR